MKKVVVTGGLGFIGSNLIKILNKKGFFVINIDKITYASNKKISQSILKIINFIKKILIINILYLKFYKNMSLH